MIFSKDRLMSLGHVSYSDFSYTYMEMGACLKFDRSYTENL